MIHRRCKNANKSNEDARHGLLQIVASIAIAAALSGATTAADQAGAATGLTVYNRGIGGQNSRQGRARFEQDVIALKPNYVFIYFGLNDTLNEPAFVSLDEFIGNLGWMITRARQAGIVPVLATIHPVIEEPLLTRHKRESYGVEGPNGKIRRYNDAIRRLAKGQAVALADFAAVAAGKTQAGTNLVAPDGVHLTVEGNRALAQCFLDAVAGKLNGQEIIVCLGDSVTYGVHSQGAGTAEGDTYPARLRRLAHTGN